MIRESITLGGGDLSHELMKFTLTYQGELRSNDDYRRKWLIRRQLDPQLRELWRVTPSLLHVLRHRHMPSGAWFRLEQHHSVEKSGQYLSSVRVEDTVDLCAPVIRGGRQFIPLVRDTFALQCALKIIFLRKEEPGRLYQGGDLDNRLKTLFDAFSAPTPEQIVKEDSQNDPIYCLLEDDRLITKIEVDTHRLLSAPGASEHEVHLFIEVDVRVSQSRQYNHPFLGD